MNTGRRVREVRITMHLNQTEFGKRLGVAQSTVGQWETGDRAVSDSTILLICSTYNVNEAWLRTGAGEMFTRPADDVVTTLAQMIGLDELGIAALRCYATLDDKRRAAVRSYMDDVINEYMAGQKNSANANAPADIEVAEEIDIEAELALYRRELELERSKKMYGVLPDIG